MEITVKQYLKSYEDSIMLLKRCQNLLDELKDEVIFLEQHHEFSQSQKKENDEIKYIIDTLRDDILKEMRDARGVACEIQRQIQKLPEDERICLKLRYIDKLTWEEVANKMFCSVSSVHILHNKALNTFDKIV